MQGHAALDPGRHVPDGLHVRISGGLPGVDPQGPDLDRIEGVDTSPSPVRSAMGPGKLPLLFEQRLAGRRDQQIAVKHPIGPRHLIDLSDLRHDVTRVEPRVGRALEQEVLITEHIHGMGGTAQDDGRDISGRVAQGGRVTEGAIDPDPLEPNGLLGETHRQLASLLPAEAQRGPAAGTGKVFREHLRQHQPDPIGDAVLLLGTDGAVLEIFGHRVVRQHLLGLAEQGPPGGGATQGQNDHQDPEPTAAFGVVVRHRHCLRRSTASKGF